ncbi:MAG: hypothetical protein ACI32B_07195 [Erysipelotrichaceae bacterium]
MRYREKIKKKIWMITILVILIFMSVGGTLAAYVSRSYVKGVATTPKQGFSLSSDYLSAVSKNAEQDTYPDKKILLTEKVETDTSPYTLTFSITNTADGSISTKRMQYYLAMGGLPEGATVKYGNTDITNEVTSEDGYRALVMNAYTRVTHTYSITIPKDKMASAADIIVTATPDADSDTSGFILAGRLQPSIIGTVAPFSHEGKFLETGEAKDYAAFNYQISVSNAGEGKKMKLTWNKDLVEIDPLFLESINNNGGNSGSLELTMNDANSSYLIQFYRLPGGSISDWTDLKLDFKPAD